MMKTVIHAPTDIAGQMGLLCRGLREQSWKAIGYNWFHTYIEYGSALVQTDAYEMIHGYERAIDVADIIHFHNGNTVLDAFSDLSKLQSLGKKMVMHHWGNDVRNVDARNARNQYKLPAGYYTNSQIQSRLAVLSAYIDAAIIQDYELFEDIEPYYKRIFILPLAIDCSVPFQYPSPSAKEPLVVHAPTNQAFKGTIIIEQALDVLRKECAFEYKRIEKMSHAQAQQWYLHADLIIDQVLCGTFGLFSVEAMAMGKPVVAYIRDDVRKKLPDDLPIASGDPHYLVDVLRPLIKDASLRHQLGIAGRKYVEHYHDFRLITQQLISIYNQL